MKSHNLSIWVIVLINTEGIIIHYASSESNPCSAKSKYERENDDVL